MDGSEATIRSFGSPSLERLGHRSGASRTDLHDQGRRVLEAIREYLRIDGRVIIAGLSDGGVALSKSWPEADAYIVVSGVSSTAQCPGKPVLVLHGTRDRIASISYARRLAERCPKVELEAMETAHFLLATAADVAAEHLRVFDGSLEGH